MSQAAAVPAAASSPLVIGRYALFDELAAGGMATVHLGRLLGPEGFGRTVAVKRLHAHYLSDQEFITMFMDEARIVARIRHPNVVPMVDVVQGDHGLFLVMEYVHGESLSRLMRNARKAGEPIPPRIVAAIMCGVLLGLHAAHETKGSDGKLINVVHRDVSPQNVIVGSDGTARVLDFGIAKAAGRAQVTREGQIKGKLAYMAPEQIRGQVDRRTDVFAAAVVLWEMLAGRRLHDGAKDVDIVTRVVHGKFPQPSQFAPHVDFGLDEVVMRGLAVDVNKRFASAREMALELERKVGLASPSEVSEWVERLAREVLEQRSDLVTAMELAAGQLVALDSRPPPSQRGTVGTPVAFPPQGNIPIHHEPMQSNGDTPSSSAVFAHAQTSPDAPVVATRARRISGGAWAIVVISAVLAVAGLGLGSLALVRRRPAAPATVSPLAMPVPQTTTMPPVRAMPVPVTGPAPSAQAAGIVELDEAVPARTAQPSAGAPSAPSAPPAPSALSLPPAAPLAAATLKAAAPLAAPPVPATRKASKPQCEPPYTVDDVGHRHYKPECMGLE